MMGWLCLLLCQAAAAEDVRPGLLTEIYSVGHALDDFPVFPADRKPDVRRIDKLIHLDPASEHLPGTRMTDHFVVRWKGLLRIPKTAQYTFFLESDDGSRLRINGREVVGNGGLHAMEEKSGELALAPGDHEIEVDLFQNSGGMGCRLSWEADGLPKELVPEKAFFRKKDKDLDK